MSTPTLYIVGGPNGVGKTTLALKYVEVFGAEYLGADKIAAEISPDEPSLAAIQAGRLFVQQLDARLAESRSLIVETTLSGLGFRRAIKKARAAGFQVSLSFVFIGAADSCVIRVRQRVRKGGHHVPEEDVRRRFYRSINNFWHEYRQLADEWLLLYNGVGGTIDVAKGAESQSSVLDESLFQMFSHSLGGSENE